MPSFAKTKTFALNESPIASADLNSIGNDVASFLNTTKIDEANIQPGTITGTSLSTNAAIAVSKLAAGTANQVLINNATPTPAWTTVSGDLTNALGVFTIGAGAVTGSKIAAATITEANITAGTITTASLSGTAGITSAQLAGAIAAGKLTLTSANIIVGNGSNVGAGVAMSGDVTIDNTGVTTIGSNKVTTSKINAGAVDGTKLSTSAILLGAATTSVNQTGITTVADLTSLTVTATVPSGGRSVRVTAHVPAWSSTVGDTVVSLLLAYDGSSVQQAYQNIPRTDSGVGGGTLTFVHTPAAGSHTWKLQAGRVVGTGSITAGNNLGAGQITVELI